MTDDPKAYDPNCLHHGAGGKPLELVQIGLDVERDQDSLLAIGAVVRSSSLLENELRMTFYNMMGANPLAHVISGGQGADWLMNMVVALAKHHHRVTEKELGRLNTIISRCKDAMRARNRYVHSVWGVSEEKGPHLAQSRRHSPAAAIHRAGAEDVVATNSLLQECRHQLFAWDCRNIAEVHEVELEDGSIVPWDESMPNPFDGDWAW